tara:strand:- start:740 stop:988 length:249 start_codon:yes stop_codon:yes gene_type:complete
MPITKHHRKKYPNSEWVRRRNIRRAAQRQASKLNTSASAVATVDSSEPQVEVRSTSVTPKPKGLWQRSMAGIKRVFAGQRGS